MDNFKNHIDKLVSKVLNEEIENKVKQITETMSGEWTEIEVEEVLKGGQKKLDVAAPKGKITSADFKKLRDAKKHKEEVEEYYHSNSKDLGDYDDNEEDFRKRYKMMDEPSSDDGDYSGMRNVMKKRYNKDMGISDDEDFAISDKEEMEEVLKGGQKKLDVAAPKGKLTSADFKKLRNSKEAKVGEKYGKNHGMEEQETEEGNAFSGALADAKKNGKDSFEVDGKEYSVKENKNSLKLTEDELINMIEKIVMEQKVKDNAEKNNITKKTAQGLKDTDKVLGQNKKINDDHTKEVVKKMKEYMKDMFMGGKGYEDQPEDFPQSNYDMEKEHKEKKYNPSDAVEEYIDAFAYPGMTNLVYDEIKPDDEMIGKQMKGDAKNGNAITGKDGKALGNVSKRSLKVGEKFKKNFDENLYGAEQMNGSYKRVPQPVDVAGDKKQSGSLGKAEKILNKLESTENKKDKIVSEEMNKMKNLIGYNRKTQ